MEDEKNELNSFTFFRNYYEAIKFLSIEEKGKFLNEILKYVFENEKPELEGHLKALWQLIKIPLDTSKNNGKKNKKVTDISKKKSQTFFKKSQRPILEKEEEEIEIEIIKEKNIKKRKAEQDVLCREGLDDVITSATTACSKSGNNGVIKEIIEHLNQKAGTKFRTSSTTTTVKINARLNEGYKLDDFISVIDKKTDEWKGTEMEKYLRPETLFGTKFEGYLNQKNIENRKGKNPKYEQREYEDYSIFYD